MDYFNDVLTTFLDLDRSNYIAVYGRVRELSESKSNQNYLDKWSEDELRTYGVLNDMRVSNYPFQGWVLNILAVSPEWVF